jgi:hypothetical protein
MVTLTKAEAARQLGISRTALYKLIDQGKLSATPEGLIDTAELVRVISTVNVHRERSHTSLDRPALDAAISGEEHHERPAPMSSERQPWTSSERQLTSTYEHLVDILREQLQAAQERERAYQEHIAQLTTMLEQAHQQNQRLLDLPRTPPPASLQAPPGATQRPTPAPGPPAHQDTPQRPREAQAGDPRGAMRRRIVALLHEHPEGLTPAEIRDRLGVGRSLGDTLLEMLRYGLVQRVGHGTYVATAPAHHHTREGS